MVEYVVSEQISLRNVLVLARNTSISGEGMRERQRETHTERTGK